MPSFTVKIAQEMSYTVEAASGYEAAGKVAQRYGGRVLSVTSGSAAQRVSGATKKAPAAKKPASPAQLASPARARQIKAQKAAKKAPAKKTAKKR